MLHVQQFNRLVIPVQKLVPSISTKSNITTFQPVVFTSLATILTPKSKKSKIYPLQKMSSNAQHHLLEELVLNCPIPNPSTTNFSTIPKNTISTLDPHIQTQPTTPPIPVKTSHQSEPLKASVKEKDVAKKSSEIRLLPPHHHPERNVAIADINPNNPTPINLILQPNRRRTKLVPAVKFAVPDDFKISPFYFKILTTFR